MVLSKRITELPVATSVTTDDYVPIVDVGTAITQKATISQILAVGGGGILGSGTVGQIAYFTGSSAIGSEAGSSANALTWDTINNALGVGISAPISTADINGSFGLAITSVSSNITLNSTHYTILANASSGSIILTLPAAASTTRRRYEIKKIDSTINTITIDGNASETIDGQATYVLSTQYQFVTIVTDGSAWYIV